MNTIVQLPTGSLIPNPQNPRKSLGEIEELTASIKENGVLQNLTVVQTEDPEVYKIVIGHRRHAAAKAAGLSQLPCVVTEMDDKEQLSVMLLENIQRNDLSVLEQADGFQMMLELGADIQEIVAKTGFSESTVRHRLKISELDRKTLENKEGLNISMADYIKLEKLKNIKYRNIALKEIGTNNFDYIVNQFLTREKGEEHIKKAIEIISSFAVKVDAYMDYSKYDNSETYNTYSEKMPEVPEDLDDADYYYYEAETFVILYRKGKYAAIEDDYDEKLEKPQYNAVSILREKIRAIDDAMEQTRREYIENFSEAKAKKIAKILSAWAAGAMIFECWAKIDVAEEILGIDTEGKEGEYVELFAGIEHRALAVTIYSSLETTFPMSVDYQGEINWRNEERYAELYKFMAAIGYRASDEEKQILDGTYQLITIEEEEDED